VLLEEKEREEEDEALEGASKARSARRQRKDGKRVIAALCCIFGCVWCVVCGVCLCVRESGQMLDCDVSAQVKKWLVRQYQSTKVSQNKHVQVRCAYLEGWVCFLGALGDVGGMFSSLFRSSPVEESARRSKEERAC